MSSKQAVPEVVYTAFADFEINVFLGSGEKVAQATKQGEVFTPPTGWTEVVNIEPGNNGCKFLVPGEILYNEKGEKVDQQMRWMILPLNKS